MHAYIQTCMHACIHTYMHTYIHACMNTYIHTCILFIRTYVYVCMYYTYIHTCMHAYIILFSRALTGPIFGPIPNAKLKFFPQLKKLNIFLFKSILNLSHAKHVPQASSMTCTHQIDCGWVLFLRKAPLT